MSFCRRHKLFLGFLFFLSTCGIAETCYGQRTDSASPPGSTIDSFDIKKVSFLLPQPLPAGKYTQTFTIQYLVLPRDWVTTILKAPVFTYAGKYTLPYGFNLQGGLQTLFISNRFTLGPFWNYSSGNYHLGLGYQAVFNLGFLNEFGFSTQITGWEQQPSVTLGYSFKTMAVILRGDMYWANGFHIRDGENVLPYTKSFINGYSVSANLEQRLWKNRIMSAGVKIYNCKYNFIAWPAFPVNSYKYWFPEFQLGLEF
jgi:hypothetical protein